MHRLALPPPVGSPLLVEARPTPVDSRPPRVGTWPIPTRSPCRRRTEEEQSVEQSRPEITFLQESVRPRDPLALPPPLEPTLNLALQSQTPGFHCSHPVYLGKDRTKKGLRKVKGEKIGKRVKSKVEKRRSLQRITWEMTAIRKDLEEREKEIREMRQIHTSLRVRKERIENLERSNSPLFQLYQNKSSISGKACLLCGRVRTDPRERVASAVPNFPVVVDDNPLNLGIPTQEQVQAREEISVELKVQCATNQKRRQNLRRGPVGELQVDPRWKWQKVATGGLVDVTVATPPPPLRLGEERVAASVDDSDVRVEGNLIGIHGKDDNLIEYSQEERERVNLIEFDEEL